MWWNTVFNLENMDADIFVKQFAKNYNIPAYKFRKVAYGDADWGYGTKWIFNGGNGIKVEITSKVLEIRGSSTAKIKFD